MNSEDDTLAGGLPHSEIPGSPIARISPGLFAACHVLHRLSVPRHPPDALLSRLITGAFPKEDALTTAAHRAKTPSGPKTPPGSRPARRPRMKTLLRVGPAQARLAQPDRRSFASPKGRAAPSRQAYPPRSHHNSLFTLQSTPPP